MGVTEEALQCASYGESERDGYALKATDQLL